jgi:hypothetical protein
MGQQRTLFDEICERLQINLVLLVGKRTREDILEMLTQENCHGGHLLDYYENLIRTITMEGMYCPEDCEDDFYVVQVVSTKNDGSLIVPIECDCHPIADRLFERVIDIFLNEQNWWTETQFYRHDPHTTLIDYRRHVKLGQHISEQFEINESDILTARRLFSRL